jgi:hypothetical protein
VKVIKPFTLKLNALRLMLFFKGFLDQCVFYTRAGYSKTGWVMGSLGLWSSIFVSFLGTQKTTLPSSENGKKKKIQTNFHLSNKHQFYPI